MGAIGNIVSGETVPVVLQLIDGDTGQYPQAVVYDHTGTLLITLDLPHSTIGLYAPASQYFMPDKTFITVTYIVYSDSTHVTESDIYMRDVDVFYQVDPGDYKADVSALAIEANVEGHASDALSSYDPPTKAELDAAELNIRGTDSDDLKTISDQIDIAQADLDNPDQYKANLSDVADSVWDESAIGHDTPGTMGALQNLIDEMGTGSGSSCCRVVNKPVVDHFPVVDSNTGELVSGLDSTNFDVWIFDPADCNRVVGCGDSTAIDYTIEEIGTSGLYKLEFTPDIVGVWVVLIAHSVYFPWGKSFNYVIYSASSGGGGDGTTNDDLLAFILGLY